MELLARQSQTALELFSEEWFRRIQELHKNAPVSYLIVTAERSSGVIYAPVSNLSRDLLGKFEPKFATGDLTGKIRHEVFFPRTLEGPIRDLWAAARADPNVLPPHYLLVRPIRSNEQSTKGLAVFGPDRHNDTERAEQLMSRFEPQLKETSLWRRRSGLENLINAASTGVPKLHPHLLLRLESSFSDSNSFRTKRLDLAQLGLALSSKEELPLEFLDICLNACLTSGIAALAVLYEKERYYERAARQCGTASAVKYGRHKEIRDQFKVLISLQEGFNVPPVDEKKSDPQLTQPDRPDDETSWYRMKWLNLRPMSTTLLWRGASKDFELAALMRATVSHLRRVHWSIRQPEPQYDPKEAILASLLVAQREARRFYEVARRTRDHVRQEFPILHSSGVAFYRTEELAWIDRVLNTVDGRGTFDITLTWHGDKRWARKVDLPEVNLEQLCQAVAQTTLSGSFRALTALNVHADAHFGNLLVDAGVPEDPLIISIDPKPPPETEGGFDPELESLGLKDRAPQVNASVFNFRADPLYDLAKCVMSTSGLHGPIIQRALELNSTDDGRFTLANPRDGVRHLTDTGGMSSAKLIRVGTQVPKDCLRDHDICAGALLREFQGILSADAGKPGTDDESRLGINVGLIRLWGLSVRHLFSAARDRFPSDMTTGLSLFILASAYVDAGTRQFVSVLESGSLQKVDATSLETPFRWYQQKNT